MGKKITLPKYNSQGGTLTIGQGSRVRYSGSPGSHVPYGSLGSVQTLRVEARAWPYTPTVLVAVKWDRLKDVTYHFAGYLEALDD